MQEATTTVRTLIWDSDMLNPLARGTHGTLEVPNKLLKRRWALLATTSAQLQGQRQRQHNRSHLDYHAHQVFTVIGRHAPLLKRSGGNLTRLALSINDSVLIMIDPGRFCSSRMFKGHRPSTPCGLHLPVDLSLGPAFSPSFAISPQPLFQQRLSSKCFACRTSDCASAISG